MEFFNRKEEVLEIQLTQEGKRLLAKGQFKPFYYEFFDDDVLYDTDGNGFSEEQNSSVPRIKETPRIKTQSIIYGLETEFNKLKQDIDKIHGIDNPDTNKKYLYNKNHDPLKYALGLGDYSNNYAPSWDISFQSGVMITGSTSITYSPEADYYEYIPQMFCSCSYLYQFRNDVENYDSNKDYDEYKVIYTSKISKDNTYYVIYEVNNVQLLVKELNSTFDKENFDIEIFEVETVEGEKENLKSLYFIGEQTTLDEESPQMKLQPYDAEWYFSITTDDALTMAEKEMAFDPYLDIEANNSQEPC